VVKFSNIKYRLASTPSSLKEVAAYWRSKICCCYGANSKA